MESIKRCCGCCIGNEDIAEALDFPVPSTQDRITQLLADVERTLEQKDGDVPMSEEEQNFASHLEKNLDKVTFGLQISKDALAALGRLHWFCAGLTIIAMGLNMTLKMHENKEQCLPIMKESLDIWKTVMKPILETEGIASDYMVESMHIIIEGYLLCKKLSTSSTLKRFMCASIHEKEIETWKKKMQFFLVKATAVVTTLFMRDLLQTSPTASIKPTTRVVGLEEQKRHVLKLLKLEDKEETRAVVLYGMGGLGKSTLADAIYNHVSVSKERRHCRIELGERPSKDDITNMQRQMVKNLTGQNLWMERDCKTIKDQLCKVLMSESGDPILIYIDNVLQQRDLEELLPLDSEQIILPKGSRWLITTRDESVCTKVFRGFKVEKFRMPPLNNRDAEKLFFLHAFGQEEPSSDVIQEYNDDRGLIGEMVSSICGNLPLALRVLGRSLFNTKVHEWRKKHDDLKNHGKLGLEEQITNVLNSSYNTLDGESQKAFLMACVCFYDFDYRDFKDIVESILPQATTLRLIELSLIERYSSSTQDVRIKMHDLIRTLGYQKAVEKKCAPTKMPTCKQDFLDDDKSNWSEIKWLRVPPLEDGIKAEFLEKCRDLEVIVLQTHVNGHIENPPQQLNVLSTTSSLPLALDKLKEVVYLNVRPFIEEFPVARSTRSLQVFQVFSGANIPNEAIDLHKNKLRKLICKGIAELSSYFCKEMSRLQWLRIADFKGESFPKEMGSLTSLETLNVTSSTMQELPQSLSYLRRLQVLRLDLQKLKEIPSGVLGEMKEVARLQLKLERVTSMPMQDIGQLVSLEILILTLPSVNGLMDYGVLSLKLEKLKFFLLSCKSMSSLEGVQLSCPSLECLRLEFCVLQALPSKFITSSTNLRYLYLYNCCSLQELSAEMEILKAVECLAVRWCKSLKAIAEGLMKSVESLVLVGCPRLDKLPSDLDEEKVGSMHFLSCDTHLLPPQFLPLPNVIAYSQDDWRAVQQVESFIHESFVPVSLADV